jgi:hypothetical protein
MIMERTQRRMTLRQLLTHSEKVVRDLIEHMKTEFTSRAQDYRELTRPVRRRSHYPTLIALHNALQKLGDAGEEAQQLSGYLKELLLDICEYAKKDRGHRR